MDSPQSIGRKASGPPGLPILGNLLSLADPLAFFTRCARDYGDLVPLNLGRWPALLVSDPLLIEQVLVKEHPKFVKNSFFWRHATASLGEGLLTSENELWRRQRRMAAPLFSTGRAGSHLEVVIRHTQNMLAQWKQGRTLDTHAEFTALALEISIELLFGDGLPPQDHSDVRRAATAVQAELSGRARRPFLVPDAIPLPGHLRYRRALSAIERILKAAIDVRRSQRSSNADMLEMLMGARDDSGAGMSERQLRDEAVTLLLAGSETTAQMFSWTCYLLATHPRIQERLAAEVRAAIGERAAEPADIATLPFAQQVVMEAMRIYPPSWAIGREAAIDCMIGGHPVPAGTTILMSQWVVHRDRRFFDRPTEFIPERWSSSFQRELPRFAYFPFGGGPRTCIGNRLAVQEAVLVISTMVSHLQVTAEKQLVPQPNPLTTLYPRGGVWIRINTSIH